MPITEIISYGGLGAIALLTLVQIAPIKFNPWSFIAGKIGAAVNHDISESVKALSARVDIISDMIEEREAVAARSRILNFSDEIYHDIRHSKESFDSILADMTYYDCYCDKHHEFKNRMTLVASKQIEDVYRACLDKKDFV